MTVNESWLALLDRETRHISGIWRKWGPKADPKQY
jgi:hypothetical protein